MTFQPVQFGFYVNAVDPNEAWKSWQFETGDEAAQFVNSLKNMTMADWGSAILMGEEWVDL
jgi:hypothetical protein